MSVTLVGGGQIAEVLASTLSPEWWFQTHREGQEQVLEVLRQREPKGASTLIYAHGPAGDAAVAKDYDAAVYACVTLPALIRHEWPERRVIYLSTLIDPWCGSEYANLKRAGEHVLGLGLRTVVLRFGSLLRYHEGVAGTFYRRGLLGEPLSVPPDADCIPYSYVDEASLVGAMQALTQPSTWAAKAGGLYRLGVSTTVRGLAEALAVLTQLRVNRSAPSSITVDRGLPVKRYEQAEQHGIVPVTRLMLERWVAEGPGPEERVRAGQGV